MSSDKPYLTRAELAQYLTHEGYPKVSPLAFFRVAYFRATHRGLVFNSLMAGMSGRLSKLNCGSAPPSSSTLPRSKSIRPGAT